MKKGKALKRLLAAAAIAALLAGSCSNFFAAKPKGHGSVTVRFSGAGASKRARTIAPDLTTAADSFLVTLTSGSLTHTATLGTGVGSTVFDAIEVGTWDVSVVASSASKTIATGSTSGLVVTAGGSSSASVTLAPETASGVGSIVFSFTLGTAATTVNASLRRGDTDADSGITPVPNLISGGTSLSTITCSNVPAGSYSLVMDFLAAGGIDLGTFRESVVVYANIASNKWVDSEGNLIASRTFSAAEFCQQDSSLSGLSVAWSDSSTPALTPTFASDNFSYDAGLVAKGSTVSFTPTSSISGQAITYTWNGGSPRSIVTGQASSPLSLVGGTNTILITVEAPNGAFGCFSTYTVTMQWVPAYSGSTGIEMVKIPAGSFNNGSSVVTLSSFLLGKYDVTQAQYAAVIGSNPSSFLGDTSRPVEQVNWYDALVFCNTLSMQEGLRPVYSIAGSTDPASWGTVPTSESTTWDSATMDLSAEGYRLPTEAEWEYAAMGGNLTHGYTYAGSNSIDGVAWYTANSGSTTHPVGQKAPNELGLYDMCGNVCNWCWDWYNDNLPTAAQTDPTGPESGSVRVIHAGEYENVASNCEIFTRGSAAPNGSINYIGFRVARGTQISGWRMVAAESGGSIWYSSDSGSTWNKSSSAPALNWTSLAGSADGMRLIATNGGYQVNGGIYLSTDGGATWTQTSALSEQYSGLASSADGKILGATDYDGSSNFFYSTNSGATWQSTTLPNPTGYDVFWVRPRCSTDGTRWVIDDGGAGHPYPAVWYGTFVAGSWTWVETGITYSQYGEDLCGSAISGDGSMILAGTTNHLYTWYTPTQEMKEVSFSSTGYLLPAISSDGTCYSVATSDSIFVSTDQGGTWKAQTTGLPTLSMSSICLSTDGSVIVAGSVVDAAKPNSGDLYISKDVGATYSILSSLDVAAGGKLNWQAVFMQP